MNECVLSSHGAGQGTVAGCCEHGDDPMGCIKDRELSRSYETACVKRRTQLHAVRRMLRTETSDRWSMRGDERVLAQAVDVTWSCVSEDGARGR